MNRQLTVVLVAVVGVVAVAGGAVLFTGQNGGADAATAANDAAAAVEQSTPTSQPSEPTDRPTATEDTATSESDSDTPSSDEQSVERANEPPTADAGEDATVREWVRTTLDASASSDPDGDDANLSYEWTQVAGDDVELYDANTATPEFFAPESQLRTELTFEVTVTDEDGATATDTVTIHVRESRSSDDHETDANESDDGDGTDVEDSPGADDDGAADGDDGSDGRSDDSTETTRDDIAQAKFGADYDDLNAEDAATVYELSVRHDGDWDASTVQTRDELAQEMYGVDFDDLGANRSAVQEAFDTQFGDTGGPISKSDISTAKWGDDDTYETLSNDSAGEITELYDRQPWAGDTGTEHVRTRKMWAHRLFGADLHGDLDDLSRDQRLEVERRYNAQFGN